jgi:membrane protein
MPKAATADREKPRWMAGLLLAGLTATAWAFKRSGPKGRAKARTSVAGKTRGERALERPTWRDWKEIFKRVYKALGDDRLLAVAAGVVFYGLLAFFPAITALVSIYGLVTDPGTIREHVSLVSGILPAGGFDIMREQIDRLLEKDGGKLSAAFIFGTMLAIWSANAGMKAMMDALNVIYNVPEERNFIRLNAVSLALTVGAIAALLLAIGCVVVFPLIFTFLGLGSWGETLASWLRWPILFFGLIFALAVLYRFGPSPHGAKWRWITPGSFFSAILWVIGSAALSYYLSNFANYDATYGSVGAAIGLMMWMWMSSIVVLLGAQLNDTLDNWNAKPDKPMQPPEQQTPAERKAAGA